MKPTPRLAIYILVPLVALTLLVIAGARAKKVSPLGWSFFGPVNQAANVAHGGYDVVSYQQGAPLPGSPQHTVMHKGVNYHFSSEANAQSFRETPARYLPQYGGYCAFAVSKGFTVNVEPDAFAVLDGKLYLFADKDIRKEYLAAGAAIREASDEKWQASGRATAR